MNYGPWRSVFGPELQLIKAASPQKGHVLCSVLSRSVLSNSLRPNGERRLAGYSPWGFSRQEYWSGCCILLQGIFPTQRLNPGLPHCRQILYHLSHQGSPRMLEWVAYPFSRGSSRPRNWTEVSWIAGRFFTSWTTREAPEEAYNSIYSSRDSEALTFLRTNPHPKMVNISKIFWCFNCLEILPYGGDFFSFLDNAVHFYFFWLKGFSI